MCTYTRGLFFFLAFCPGKRKSLSSCPVDDGDINKGKGERDKESSVIQFHTNTHRQISFSLHTQLEEEGSREEREMLFFLVKSFPPKRREREWKINALSLALALSLPFSHVYFLLRAPFRFPHAAVIKRNMLPPPRPHFPFALSLSLSRSFYVPFPPLPFLTSSAAPAGQNILAPSFSCQRTFQKRERECGGICGGSNPCQRPLL